MWIQFWKAGNCFFPANIVEKIIDSTNKYLAKMRERVSHPRNVCIFGSFVHTQQINLQELWVDDGTAPEFFRATMSIKRFATLLRALRFDDLDTQETWKKVDNLALIRNMQQLLSIDWRYMEVNCLKVHTELTTKLAIWTRRRTFEGPQTDNRWDNSNSTIVPGHKRKGNSQHYVCFGKKCLLVSYVPKKGKNVLMISTMHNSDTKDESTGDMCKPEVITFYNLTKGGVDVVDEMKASYSVSRISYCWPLTVFFTIMKIACINSLIIYKCNTNDQ
ncbi:hypothetical protein PR048_012927 [Dryococelus australis]|uniref:PiggyBac transposable element-derived protein domain-containing protein n=1 Tax=Dryococelus australis TaxID=614101 RepID=A0ABQ9HR16_9NEOP|nr:hypothetical protein PR048_012927 [Dryococelus australis]